MFSVTIAYLKENSEIKDKFLKEILTQKYEKLIFGLQNGESTYTQDPLIRT